MFDDEVALPALRRLAQVNTQNADVFTELVLRTGWVRAATTGGTDNFNRIVDAAIEVPVLRSIADDAVASLAVRRADDLSRIVQHLPNVNRVTNLKPELVEHVVSRRVDAADVFEAMGETPVDGAAPVLACLLYTSPSPRDKRQSRMPSSA